jgi:hypothetical protein
VDIVKGNMDWDRGDCGLMFSGKTAERTLKPHIISSIVWDHNPNDFEPNWEVISYVV